MRSDSLVQDKLLAEMHALVKVNRTFAYFSVGREIVSRRTGTRIASLCVLTVVGTRLEAAAFIVIYNNNNICLFYSDHSCLGISGRFTQYNIDIQ